MTYEIVLQHSGVGLLFLVFFSQRKQADEVETRLRSKYVLIDRNDFATISAAQKVMAGAWALPKTQFRMIFCASEP